MNVRRIGFSVLAGAVLYLGWRSAGWAGIALAAGAVVMFVLLHVNRLMFVLKRAANRPKGYVDSAVMLNARLKAGVTLLHVMTLTSSLGEQLSAEGEEPQVYRWSDPGEASVTCEFADGRLAKWTLARPEQPAP